MGNNNYVAKNDYNKSAVHRDRKNDYSRKDHIMTLDRVEEYAKTFGEADCVESPEDVYSEVLIEER